MCFPAPFLFFTEYIMSKFKSLKQQSAEKVINAMFAGLEDDQILKSVIEVMYGIRPESDLDELARINEGNLKLINEKMALDISGNIIKKSNDIVNGDS